MALVELLYQKSGNQEAHISAQGAPHPVISAIQTAQQMSQASKDTKDGRMQALAAASTGLAAYNAAQAVKGGRLENAVGDDLASSVNSAMKLAAWRLGW